MPLSELFKQTEDEYFRLKGQLAAGRITPDQFEAALKERMVQDAQGRWWTIGAQSGNWYVHDGQNWVQAEPPRISSILSERSVASPVSDPQSLVCPRCRAALRQGKKFCTICGSSVQAAISGVTSERLCPQCKQTVAASKKFCPRCGLRLA